MVLATQIRYIFRGRKPQQKLTQLFMGKNHTGGQRFKIDHSQQNRNNEINKKPRKRIKEG